MSVQVFSAIILIMCAASGIIAALLIKRICNEYELTYAWYRLPFFTWVWQVVPFKYLAGIVVCVTLFVWSAWHLIVH